MSYEQENVPVGTVPSEGEASPRRQRITPVAADRVVSTTGMAVENIDLPKRKRGRPSKADIAQRAALVAASQAAQTSQSQQLDLALQAVQAPAGDTTPTTDEAPAAPAPAETPVAATTRRGRSREELIAAAEAKLAQVAWRRERAGVAPETQPAQPSLIEKLQQKVAAQSGQTPSETGDEAQAPQAEACATSPDAVWADAPEDGNDFIIVRDIPAYDSSPAYDWQPQQPVVHYEEEPEAEEPEADDDDMDDFADLLTASGVLEMMPDGFGFLRSSDYNYMPSPDDVYLTMEQCRRAFLRTGDVVECRVRPPKSGERYFTMTSLVSVNGRNPDDIRDRITFENLTPLFPDQKFNICGDPTTTNVSTRVVDLFAPIGKGQRALIVAQPKTGKTVLMKNIANAIAANHPEAYVMMLLIDERPEEVTDMARTVNAEVIASTFDEPAEHHVKIAGLVLEKAKRMVECGHDVVIFLDSITRLARAYNTVTPTSSKILSGGVEATALQKPKRFFGAARNIEGGGSLTIIATALTDTGSRMDEVIFEEFKGTGNSELQLDRGLANKRVFPAVNLVMSSTRRDDLLLDKTTSDRMWILRKSIADMNPAEAMTQICTLMGRTHSNDDFLLNMNK